MQLDRRSLLTGAGTLVGAGLAGCSGGSGGQEVPEPKVDGKQATVGSQNLSDELHAVLRPASGMVLDYSAEQAGEKTRFLVTITNIDPAPIKGTLVATLTHREDGEKQYETTFTMKGDTKSTVEMTIPVSFEEYSSEMSLPEFEVTDLKER